MKTKRNTKRLTSIILSVIILLSLLPQLCVFAENSKSGDWEYKVNDDGSSVTIVKYIGSDGASEVTIPDKIDGKSVTVVGDGSKAFEKVANVIIKVTFPTTVEKIGDNAFSNCTTLWGNNIDELTALKSIGKNAFSQCNMGTTRFHENLEIIGDEAFHNTKVGYLSFGSKLKIIGKNAFSNCPSLTQLDLSKAENLETIEEQAFYNCQKLSSVDFCGSEDDCGVKNLKTIGNDAFSSCSSLKKLDLSKAENLETIGKKAFFNCQALNSVDFSGAKKLKTIDDEGFMQCKSLTTVDLSKTAVETIGERAFESCSEMDDMDSAPTGLTSITLPETLKTIGKSAFFQNYALTSIILPKALEYIGDGAFENCLFLTGDVIISENVSYLGEGAFALTEVSVKLDANNKNYQYDENGVLYNADKTLLLYVPHSLESLVVPDTVKRIGKYAFCDVDFSSLLSGSMPQISNVTLPDGLEDIGENAFFYCISLSEITLPKKLKRIELRAFTMTGLSEITVPESVIYIHSEAFSDSSLESVTYEGSEKRWKNFLANNSFVPGDINKEGDPFEDYNMTYLYGTYTTVAPSGKITCAVDDGYSGKTVIIALYKDGSLAGVCCKVYNGTEDITYTPNADYDSAKVMVWSDLETLAPVTAAEIVNLK